ncbi:MAG TPA: cytochrome c3 family protein [Pirellulaceae bacterium]|nr:cytochrome c3 family protein [Pirellulaceae bacterium]
MIQRLTSWKTGYHRPNQDWQCGRECPGCPLGPTSRGECQAEALSVIDAEDCVPQTCKPVRSLRWYRGRITFVVTLATLIGLTLVLVSPRSHHLLSPGPLSGSHAQILAGDEGCAACHAAGGTSPATWLLNTVSGATANTHSQTELCLNCHSEKFSTGVATNPHNLPSDVLKALTAKATKNKSNNSTVSAKLSHFTNPLTAARDAESPIGCSACHREHHGHENDLKRLSDQACQTCHQQHITHFATDHPEFVQWPRSEGRAFRFDHNSHAFKHFAEKNKSFDCSACHQSDPTGAMQLLKPFEISCAECHAQSVDGSRGGWTFFSLPMIDLAAIKSAAASIGEWPSHAIHDFDGELPATMRLLLTADESAAAALSRLGDEFHFADVDADDSAQVSDAVELLWGIKRLMWDLSVDGREAIRKRLEQTLAMKISDQELQMLTSGFDQAKFLQARSRWMPGLAEEMEFKLPQPISVKPTVHNLVVPGINEVLARIQDVMTDDMLLSENPLKLLMLNRPAQVPATNHNSGTQASGDDEKRERQLPTVLYQQRERPQSTGRIENQFVERASPTLPSATGSDDLLAENPLQKLWHNDHAHMVTPSSPQSGQPNSNNPDEQIVAPTNREVGNALNREINSSDRRTSEITPGVERQTIATNAESAFADPAKIQALERTLAELLRNQRGAWYLDDANLLISYRHVGHADPFLKAWTELAVKASRSQAKAGDLLLASITSPAAPGQCLTCHAVDADRSVKWMPDYRHPKPTGTTKFSHAPHVIQPETRQCQHCHELHEGLAYSQTTVAASQRTEFTPLLRFADFKPITKATCVQCHQPGAASSGCTSCHSYHSH